MHTCPIMFQVLGWELSQDSLSYTTHGAKARPGYNARSCMSPPMCWNDCPGHLSSKATQWVKAQHEGALSPSCISGNTRRFHTQLNKGPETP